LDNILLDLIPLSDHAEVTRFPDGIEDESELGGLVEDIRDAVMAYQARP
jgi:hypothetical protein